MAPTNNENYKFDIYFDIYIYDKFKINIKNKQ